MDDSLFGERPWRVDVGQDTMTFPDDREAETEYYIYIVDKNDNVILGETILYPKRYDELLPLMTLIVDAVNNLPTE